MRLLAVACVLALSPSANAPQALPGQRSVMLSQERAGGRNVMVVLEHDGFYIDGPVASVPAEPSQPGVPTKASAFSIRTWTEGGRARVVVYAMTPDPRTAARSMETPIATFLMAQGDTLRVPQTEQWGAAPVILRAVQRLGGRGGGARD